MPKILANYVLVRSLQGMRRVGSGERRGEKRRYPILRRGRTKQGGEKKRGGGDGGGKNYLYDVVYPRRCHGRRDTTGRQPLVPLLLSLLFGEGERGKK